MDLVGGGAEGRMNSLKGERGLTIREREKENWIVRRKTDATRRNSQNNSIGWRKSRDGEEGGEVYG